MAVTMPSLLSVCCCSPVGAMLPLRPSNLFTLAVLFLVFSLSAVRAYPTAVAIETEVGEWVNPAAGIYAPSMQQTAAARQSQLLRAIYALTQLAGEEPVMGPRAGALHMYNRASRSNGKPTFIRFGKRSGKPTFIRFGKRSGEMLLDEQPVGDSNTAR